VVAGRRAAKRPIRRKVRGIARSPTIEAWKPELRDLPCAAGSGASVSASGLPVPVDRAAQALLEGHPKDRGTQLIRSKHADQTLPLMSVPS
jgi:hypothetical protein